MYVLVVCVRMYIYYVGPVIEHMLRTLPRYPLTLMSQHFITFVHADMTKIIINDSILQRKIMQGGRGGLEGKGVLCLHDPKKY